MSQTQRFRAYEREKFLAIRKRTVEQALAAQKFQSENVIVVDPEDEIICDVCNDEIVEALIWVNSYGAYCSKCRRRVK